LAGNVPKTRGSANQVGAFGVGPIFEPFQNLI
jgi:hypothetical protein